MVEKQKDRRIFRRPWRLPLVWWAGYQPGGEPEGRWEAYGFVIVSKAVTKPGSQNAEATPRMCARESTTLAWRCARHESCGITGSFSAAGPSGGMYNGGPLAIRQPN